MLAIKEKIKWIMDIVMVLNTFCLDTNEQTGTGFNGIMV